MNVRRLLLCLVTIPIMFFIGKSFSVLHFQSISDSSQEQATLSTSEHCVSYKLLSKEFTLNEVSVKDAPVSRIHNPVHRVSHFTSASFHARNISPSSKGISYKTIYTIPGKVMCLNAGILRI